MGNSIRFNSEDSNLSTALQKQVQKAIDVEIDKIIKEIKKQIPSKMGMIKSEILGSYQVIATTTVQKVFMETYGENYDVASLNNSLTLGLGNDLRPIFSYNKDIFKFDTTLKKNERAFNQNARQYASFRNTLEDPEFYTQEEEDAYIADSNPFDEALDDITESNTRDYNIFSPHNKQNQQGGYASLSETFEKAKTEALNEFEKEYITHIKPRILKKYGIKMG